MARNIFVIGLDDFNRRKFDALARQTDYVFHPLLDTAAVRYHEPGTFVELVRRAEEELRAFPEKVDGIVAFWDFPVQSMVPVLRARFNLPTPPLNAVLRCEHKYWGRKEQAEVIPEYVPGFHPVDPFRDDALAGSDLSFPFWIKPIKATNSELAFRIETPEDLPPALEEIRRGITRIARSFDQVLGLADLPLEIAEITGHFCVAEEEFGGTQHTVSGFAHHGEIHVYGIVDSINYPGTSSFFEYRYPSTLSAGVRRRMGEACRSLMRHIGFDHEAFNVEFFYDAERDRLGLLEVNPRISQSHADLYEKVDGSPNHRIMVDLSVGRRPYVPHREGRHPIAAKFLHRSFEDARVARVPEPEEVAEVEAAVPDALIDVRVRRGDRLSELTVQDAYSFELAHIYVGGTDDEQLRERYEACVERLGIELEDVGPS